MIVGPHTNTNAQSSVTCLVLYAGQRPLTPAPLPRGGVLPQGGRKDSGFRRAFQHLAGCGALCLLLIAGAMRAQMPAGTPVHDVNAKWLTDHGSQVYNVKAPIYAGGAVGDGVADDTAAIRAAYNAAMTVGKSAIFFPPGAYKITSPLTIRGDRVLLYGYRSKLDFSSLTSGTAITITAAGTGSPYYQLGALMEGLEIVGPGAGSKVNGILFDTAAEAGPSHFTFRDVNLHDFAVGHTYSRFSYSIDWFGSDIWNTATAINMPGPQNTERISYMGGDIYNNGLVVNNAASPNGDIYFTNVSVDYNSRLATINGGQVFFLNSHAEFGNISVPIVTVTGGAAHFTFTNGEFLATGTVTAASIVTSDSSSQGVFFDHVSMFGMHSTTDFFGSGTGPVILKNIMNFPTGEDSHYVSQAENIAVDGSFEASSIWDDVSITRDSAPITARFTGANIALTQSAAQAHSGRQSLRATKTGGRGIPASFVIKVPIPKESIADSILWYAKPGTQMGTLYISLGWFGGCFPTSYGTMPCNRYQNVQTAIINATSSPIPWTAFMVGNNAKAPPWVTHAYVSVNMDSMNAGSIYFDDFLMTTQ